MAQDRHLLLPGTSPNDLQVGDRIARTWSGETRFGRVAEIYESTRNLSDHFHYFYAVEWEDTGLTERGYMRIGLKKAGPTVTRMLGI